VAADPADQTPASPRRATGQRELALRVVSAVVLAPLAILIAYVGGWPFVLFWGAAAVGVWWEWSRLVAGPAATGAFAAGAAGLVVAVGFAGFGQFAMAIGAIVLAAIAVAGLVASERRVWTAVGVGYAGSILVAPVTLRHDPDYGFVAIVFLFSVVWVTDVMAYVVGRLVGGPKLAPRLSPNKTWSGAVGGVFAAVVAGLATVRAAGLDNWMVIALVVLGLSICSQAGDIFESRLKRRHGAKDASQLIPGHGGLMDRLDGFVAAALAAALLGALRAGGAPARGLLVW
jgi:phosphatidate cytidylyltransferase